jgi:hypothetical protein
VQHEPDGPRDPDDASGDASASDVAWRAIVENYGERPELDEQPPAPPVPPVSDAPFGGRFGDLRDLGGAAEDEDEPFLAEEEHYEPPAPPPLPRVAPDRMVAWVGVFGSPVVLLAALIFSISLPTWLGYLLVAGFVGGFVYLVYKMPRGPRDPWDDGAQV